MKFNTNYFRIQIADVEYRKGFEDELKAFKDRIQRRAKEKMEAAIAEAEEEEKKNRLGPGGLDPVEVFESLPEVIHLLILFYLCISQKKILHRTSPTSYCYFTRGRSSLSYEEMCRFWSLGTGGKYIYQGINVIYCNMSTG